jgi:hypothetical protein
MSFYNGLPVIDTITVNRQAFVDEDILSENRRNLQEMIQTLGQTYTNETRRLVSFVLFSKPQNDLMGYSVDSHMFITFSELVSMKPIDSEIYISLYILDNKNCYDLVYHNSNNIRKSSTLHIDSMKLCSTDDRLLDVTASNITVSVNDGFTVNTSDGPINFTMSGNRITAVSSSYCNYVIMQLLGNWQNSSKKRYQEDREEEQDEIPLQKNGNSKNPD